MQWAILPVEQRKFQSITEHYLLLLLLLLYKALLSEDPKSLDITMSARALLPLAQRHLQSRVCDGPEAPQEPNRSRNGGEWWL